MKADMVRRDPRVKQMANFDGANMITGRNRENASKRNTAPAPRRAKKYAYVVVEGI